MVSEERVRAVFDAVMAKLETMPRDAKTASVAWMERLELLVASGALGWVLGGTGDLLRAALALHGIELPEAAAVPVGEWSANGGFAPGWYWWRDSAAGIRPRVARVCLGEGHRIVVRCGDLYVAVASMRGEWWSIPIQPPGA